MFRLEGDHGSGAPTAGDGDVQSILLLKSLRLSLCTRRPVLGLSKEGGAHLVVGVKEQGFEFSSFL